MADVLLSVSVDTEEDNWIPSRQGVTVSNIRKLPELHKNLAAYGLRPTYFVAHSVTATPWAAAILRDLAQGGFTELGAHLHPWNTPPMTEAMVGRNTMTRNLDSELQRAKLTVLTEAHTRAYGEPPRSFRAGRFGIGASTLRLLEDLGYRIDSSVTPFVSWREYDDGPDFGPGPLTPYRLSSTAANLASPDPSGSLVEVPITVGYTRNNFELWDAVHRCCSSGLASKLHLWGGAARIGLVRKVILSPEVARERDLLAVASRVIDRGCSYLHVFLHSSSLQPGCSPFAATRQDVRRLVARLYGFIEKIGSRYSIRGVTVGEAAHALQSTARGH